MPTKSNKKELQLLPLFERFINDCKTGRRLQANGKSLTSGCVQNYAYCLKLLEKFSTEKKFILRIRPVNQLNKRALVTEKNYWNRFYKKFTDYLYIDCQHYDNYVGANIKILRVFFNYLQKELLINTGNFYKQFYVTKEDVPVITLLPEELNYLIYNTEFESSLSPLLQRVKDVFTSARGLASADSGILYYNAINRFPFPITVFNFSFRGNTA